MPSFSYHLAMFALRLKGVKRTFAATPLQVAKIRKEDLLLPSRSYQKKHALRTFKVLESTVAEIQPRNGKPSGKLIFYCHGGAFVSGPTALHWNSLSTLVEGTQTTAWLVRYPRGPEAKIDEVCANVDAAYAKALQQFSPEQIVLMGDSVGANLVLTLTQRLLATGKQPPGLIVAITPVMDSSLDHPDIPEMDKVDPMLARNGLRQAKEMVAGNRELKDAMLSPLHGSFAGFPPTHVFLGGRDLLQPDGLLAVEKMKAEQVDVFLVEGESMPHIWPLFPIMREAADSLKSIQNILLQWQAGD